MVLLTQTGRSLIITTDNLIITHALEPLNENATSFIKIPEPLVDGKQPFIKQVINSVAVSKDENSIAISTENKRLFLFGKDLKLIKEYPTNRTSSKIIFAPNTNDIIVADKTGDVYLFKTDKGREEEPPTLLLGHLSTILDIEISPCGKYVITCDRDEKIRVSSYPNTYNIVSFCLGHKAFVTCIKFVNDQVLASASGDGTVRFWDFIKGQQLNLIDTSKNVETKIVQDFCQSMDDEKVEVFNVPITDMQLILKNDFLLLLVSVYKCRGLQIYKTDLNNFESVYLGEISCKSENLTFSLREKLYILDNESLSGYILQNDEFILSKSLQLEKLYCQHKDELQIGENNAITMLYKRKFDNVQEYLERKKIRLEGTIKE